MIGVYQFLSLIIFWNFCLLLERCFGDYNKKTKSVTDKDTNVYNAEPYIVRNIEVLFYFLVVMIIITRCFMILNIYSANLRIFLFLNMLNKMIKFKQFKFFLNMLKIDLKISSFFLTYFTKFSTFKKIELF